MSIGARLKAERDRIGMTVVQFATTCGVGKNTVVDWQSGKSSPPAERLALLAEAGVDVTYVLTGVRSTQLPGTTDEEQQAISGLIGTYLNLPEELRAVWIAHGMALEKLAVDTGTAKLVRKPRAQPDPGAESALPTSDEAQQ